VLNLVIGYLNALLGEKEEGQGLVEYALIIVLVSVVSIAILTTMGGSVAAVFTNANAALAGTGS
jgi:pilus assembly protein Flp/PilA